MGKTRLIRYAIIAALLLSALIWSLADARQEMTAASFPESNLLVSGKWLREHHGDERLVIVDVRTPEDVREQGGKFIPEAVSLPWSRFRFHDTAYGIADKFVGVEPAVKILGTAGIARNSTVVLYDSVRNDGGATASYVFWVLDLLGHEKIHLLERGIEAWTAAGGSLADSPRNADPLLYQVPSGEVRLERMADEQFIFNRLGDPQYLVLDVRSREEYLGEKPNIGLTGNVLKLGHIPTAVNIDYRLNWDDPEKKSIRDYFSLQELYRGFDPAQPVIIYCHSGRRSSFTYFILRLMGFDRVILYENSWNSWGRHNAYLPAEERENQVSGAFLPGSGSSPRTTMKRPNRSERNARQLEAPKGGYVSCGG